MKNVTTPTQKENGFGIVPLLILLVVVVLVALGGLTVWHHHNTKQATLNSSSTSSKTQVTTKKSPTAMGGQIPSGWKWYEDNRLGFKFAYPDSWKIPEQPFMVATTGGEQGWTVSASPIVRQNGDPDISFSSYPANASIRDVDAGTTDMKLQDITTNDKNMSFTLVGTVDDSSQVAKANGLYASRCWPRNCTPKLTNGRFLSIDAGPANNDCSARTYCPTTLNTDGENYSIFINILKTITSL
ncbi:MAG: hypothetical protein JWN38_575 [Candidatus Saccharibacteria bacterium]|nr:hypothetical protein [Candidatus Saccharibacteria bacterium]